MCEGKRSGSNTQPWSYENHLRSFKKNTPLRIVLSHPIASGPLERRAQI
jgi:hypothetical protein